MRFLTSLAAAAAFVALTAPAFAGGPCFVRVGSTNPPGKPVPTDHTCGLPSNFGCVSPSLSTQVSVPVYAAEPCCGPPSRRAD